MMEKTHSQWWSEIDALENKGLGMFTGGLILDLDPDALASQTEAIASVNSGEVESFLESLGAKRIAIKKAETVEEMKAQIVYIFQTNAALASIAARNFESLPDEAVKSIYEEILDLQARASRRA